MNRSIQYTYLISLMDFRPFTNVVTKQLSINAKKQKVNSRILQNKININHENKKKENKNFRIHFLYLFCVFVMNFDCTIY